jgi:hypothetical protein
MYCWTNVKFRTVWWKSSNILICLSLCSLIWSAIVVNKSLYIDFLLCCFLLYFQIYCSMSLSYTFKSTYIIIKACGSWSPYIRREVSSYFRPQTSKFRHHSWHLRHRNLDFRLAVFTISSIIMVDYLINHQKWSPS